MSRCHPSIRRALAALLIALAGVAVPSGAAHAGEPPTVRLVGDSLTVQAFASPPPGWAVNGLDGRALRSSWRQVESHARAEPAVLVVALGSNDVRQRSDTMEADTARAAALPAACVVLTTVKVHGVSPFYGRRWGAYATRWNRAVRASGAVVAEWNARAVVHPGWFLADGLHLTAAGRRGYASLLIESAARC